MIGLTTLPFHERRDISAVVAIVLAIAANLNHFITDPGLAQFFSLVRPHYLSVLEELVTAPYTGPGQTLWRVDRLAGEALFMTSLGFSKLVWAFVIWFKVRGVL